MEFILLLVFSFAVSVVGAGILGYAVGLRKSVQTMRVATAKVKEAHEILDDARIQFEETKKMQDVCKTTQARTAEMLERMEG